MHEYLESKLILLNEKNKWEEEKPHLLPIKPKYELAEIRCGKVNSYS